MRAAVLFAVVSSLAMILGLMRWPSFHWELARTWAVEPSARPALEAVFNAANRYLGNYLGEFRNMTGAVAAIAEVNNYLLPLWMIVFGFSLLRYSRR